MFNCTLARNAAAPGKGGLFSGELISAPGAEPSRLSIRASRLSGNSASSGSAYAAQNGGCGGVLHVRALVRSHVQVRYEPACIHPCVHAAGAV